MPRKEIKPQAGFQEDFLSSEADIVIGGAGAGVGKTFAELLETLRNRDVPGFNAIFFRRTTVQITNPGGLWDESSELYPQFGATAQTQKLRWTFPSGAVVKFGHIEHELNVYDHQGAQYCLIIFDELTHFTKKMFFYLLSRNRSTCGVKPYVRASCNPDPESFVADLIEWWIDQEERLPNGERNPHFGYPIADRVGVVRFFLVDADNYVWGDTKQEVIDKCPHIFNNPAFASINPEDMVKSFTFIPGSIYENKKLLEKNPEYLGNLMALDETEKARLLMGNWKIKVDPLCIFNSTSVEGMFSNLYPSNISSRYITVDAARFGQDLCTIWVWHGWKVVKLIILTKSDAQETVNIIEKERLRFSIIKGNVIVDQDGVGSGVVKLGHYIGFSGGNPPLEDPGTRIKENYKNQKTQFYYRFADRVNNDEVSLPLSNENVVVDGFFGVKIKLKDKMYDVRDLIKQDMRAIKKKDADGEGKKQINSKEEQKTLLRGRSPDFADGMMLRIYFDFKGGGVVVGKPVTNSPLDYIEPEDLNIFE
jgi:hypothetical protein